ncbi:MAG: signal peptidase I [Clostridia bacterium]|nr:signal peptidase I [Clostridia bacterium]
MDNRNENEITETEVTEATVIETETAAPAKKKQSSAKSTASSIFDIIEMFAICTAVILLLFSYAARLTVVEGESMENTLYGGDYLVVHNIAYTPTRGDIVVIHKISAPTYHNPIIKRVIGVAGDTVDIDFDTWTVYVNGEAIDEPYANFEPGRIYSDLVFPLTVEEGTVFVLGDHRNYSADSRVAQLGLIDERCIVGRAVLRVLPFDHFGVMERAKYE